MTDQESDGPRATPGSSALAPCLCCGVLAGVFVSATLWINGGSLALPLTFDDAYIYLAAARTLTATGRLAVSPYHGTLAGLTSPAYALILASGGPLFDLGTFARALGIGAGIVAIVVFFGLVRATYEGRSKSHLVAFVSTLPFACSAMIATHALTGMETSLVVALLLLTCLVYARRGPGWTSGSVAAMLGVLRLDTLLLAFAVVVQEGIDILRTRPAARAERSALLAKFACPVVILAAAQAAAFLMYLRRPTADSIGARMLLYCWGSQTLASRELAVVHGIVSLFVETPIVALLAFVGGIDSFIRPATSPRAAALGRSVVFMSLGYLVAFVHFGVPLDYQIARYTVPLQVAVLILSAFAIARLVPVLTMARRSTMWVVSVGLVILLAVSAAGELRRYARVRTWTVLFKSVNSAYQQSLANLASITQAGDRIAVSDVGQAAYFLSRPILDLAGLVNPEMLAYFHSEAARCIPPQRRQLSDVPKRFGIGYVVIDADYWNPALGTVVPRGLAPLRNGVRPTRIYRIAPEPLPPVPPRLPAARNRPG